MTMRDSTTLRRGHELPLAFVDYGAAQSVVHAASAQAKDLVAASALSCACTNLARSRLPAVNGRQPGKTTHGPCPNDGSARSKGEA